MIKDTKGIYTITELAKEFGCDRATIWRWADREKIGNVLNPGNIRIFTRAEADKIKALIYTTPGYPSNDNRGIEKKIKTRGSGRRKEKKSRG